MNNLNLNDQPSAAPGEDERQMPLSFEDGKESITVAAGASRRRFGFGTMLFTGVAIAAVGSLFTMRAIGRAGASPTVGTEAETLVDKFLTEREGKADTGLGMSLLDVDGLTRNRIPTEELKKNPFILMGEEMVLQVSTPSHAMKIDMSTSSAEDGNRSRNLGWDAMCASAAAMAHVQSAMVSSNPANSMAHVNGQVLRIGETLTVNGSNVVFTIKEITKDGIVLRAWNDDLQREATFRIAVGGAN